NVLDNSHTRGNLYRTRNQRLLAGRVLIQLNGLLAGGHRHAPELSGVSGVYSQYAVLILGAYWRGNRLFGAPRHVLSVSANWLLTSRAPCCCLLECPQAPLLQRSSHVPRRSAGIESVVNWTRCGRGSRSPCKAQDQPAVGSRDTNK